MPFSAVILDREGVITPKLGPGEYLLDSNRISIADETLEALRKLQLKGIKLFIATNQSCVRRGLISLDEADKINNKIIDLLNQHGIIISGSRLCPHTDEDACDCRKPKPGMLLALCEAYGLRAEHTAMIGDSLSDAYAGNNAGCEISCLISAEAFSNLPEKIRIFPTLSASVEWLLANQL